MVTDGSYIRELYPNLCSAAFVLKCSYSRGRIWGFFSEAQEVANTYRGKLLGLMAIHLILLSINKVHPQLPGSVEVVLDCLGALRRTAHLPPYRIPTRCCHSDILKTILVHCRDLSFTLHYLHVKAHQDNNAAFTKLSRKSQLNCICDHAAKVQIAIDGLTASKPGRMFLLEPITITIFVGDQKMTSDTGDQIRFWAHHHLARQYYQEHNLLSSNQFDHVVWKSVHGTLHVLARLLQLWAAKHVLGIAGTMKFLAYQNNRYPLCPSCGTSIETCKHVARCPESGRTEAFTQSSREDEKWMLAQHTYLDLASLLLAYLRGQRSTTCIAYLDNLNLPPIYRDYAALQDVIGWDGFVTDWALAKLLPLHSTLSHESSRSGSATR